MDQIIENEIDAWNQKKIEQVNKNLFDFIQFKDYVKKIKNIKEEKNELHDIS
jgi:hypothetical protein